jgi:hypothetical protein
VYSEKLDQVSDLDECKPTNFTLKVYASNMEGEMPLYERGMN